MKKLLTTLFALIAVAATATDFNREAFTVQVLQKGKALHAQLETLRQNKQKHPKYFRFKGTDAQKKAAYAAQLKRYNAWQAEFAPASRDRLILAEAYTELKRCTDERAQDIAVELSGVFITVESIDGIYADWVVKDGYLYHQKYMNDDAKQRIPVVFDANGIMKFQLTFGSARGQWRRIKFEDGVMVYGSMKAWTQRHPRQADPFAAVDR